MSSPRAVPDEIMKNRMTNKEDDDEEEESSCEESLDEDAESDDDSSASESSGDSSLGNIMADMGIPVPAGIAAKKRSNLKLSSSTNNLMTMKLEADIDPSAIENTDQRAALEKFMSRMNTAGNYFQKPEEPSRGMPRRSRSSGDLDDIRKDAENKNNPAILFEEMVEPILPRTKRELLFTDSYWKKFFLPLSEKRRKAYTKEAVDAVRDQDLETLERILARDGDSSMEAANAQTETLLHLACRRRNHELVKFLVITAHVSVQVRDDFGKTPLHEVCWYTEPRNPSQFHSIDFLTVLAPELWFAKDKRGYTPLQYAPKNSWKDWCRFLSRHRESICEKVGRIKT